MKKIPIGKILFEVAPIMYKKSQQTAVAIGAMVLIVCLPGHANPGSSSQTNYQKNVDRMDAVLKAKPNDEAAHYYRAVSLQYMGEYQKAKVDYDWVVNNGRNPAFKQQSNLALQGLMKTLYGVGAGGRTGGTGTVAAAPSAQPSPTTKTAAKTKIASSGGGKPKVYEFYTDWCRVCQAHASEYEELKGEVSSKVDFQKLNAEDPSNSELVQKFSVQAYPTFVFVDGNGKAVFNQAGGYAKGDLKQLMGEKLGIQL
jgi:thiol-disulfide isomerase/thioredoxin